MRTQEDCQSRPRIIAYNSTPRIPRRSAPKTAPAPERVTPIVEAAPRWETTGPRLFFEEAARRSNRVAMRHKELGLWQPITWEEYAHRVRLVANGLLALGLNYGDRVGLIGENRPEWLYADLGIQAAGGVTAAIYATNSADQCAYILSHSESRFWFVEDEEQLDKYLE